MALVVIGVILYFLPLLVAGCRHHHQVGAIAVIDVFLGWTFVGWVVALAMAASRTDPRPPSDFESNPPEGWKPVIRRFPPKER